MAAETPVVEYVFEQRRIEITNGPDGIFYQLYFRGRVDATAALNIDGYISRITPTDYANMILNNTIQDVIRDYVANKIGINKADPGTGA